jgi:hypothetical protein
LVGATLPQPATYRTPQPTREEPRPVAAAVLVAVGGLLVVVEGLLTVELGSALEAFTLGLLGGSYVVQGTIVAFIGVFLFGFAFLIHGEPHHHFANGIVVLLLVVLSLVVGYGGFYLGAFLAGIGGLLAVAWTPSRPTGPVSVRRSS